MPDYVPALQARMGDWKYYVTVMKLGKIARECRLAEEIHTNKDLDELIQRAIQDRVDKEMVPYLLKEPQRFYGALVVAVYGGEPEFSPVKVDEHELINDKEQSSYGFGLLRFDGSQTYYALDGQHRLKSIQEAIKQDADLAKEEITVIILKHEETKEGLQRTRRLFSTLNRRAKPTSSGLNIAIDEDDSIAIITRRLVKESDVISKIILKALGTKTLNPNKSNDNYITTLTAFYEVNEILLGGYDGGLEIDNNFKQFRPSIDDLDAYYSFLEKVWMYMLNKCPGFTDILSGKRSPGELRLKLGTDKLPLLDENQKPIPGGNVFARPIGQYIIAETVRLASMQGKSIEDTIDAIMDNVSMDINEAPWVNVIWNPSTRHIVASKAERGLITSMIAHALGLRTNLKVRDLKKKYRATVENDKASLLLPIKWSGRDMHEDLETEVDTEDDKE